METKIKLSNIIENYNEFLSKLKRMYYNPEFIVDKENLVTKYSDYKQKLIFDKSEILNQFVTDLLNDFSEISKIFDYNENELPIIMESINKIPTCEKIFTKLLNEFLNQDYKDNSKDYVELLALKNKDLIIEQYFRKFNSEYELSSNLNAIEKISFEIFKERLDYSYDFLIIDQSNKCIALLGRDQYCENEEDYEYTVVLNSFDKNLNSIKDWIKILKSNKQLKIFSINKMIGLKNKNNKYYYDPAYQFEKAKNNRNKIINEIIFLKIMNEIVLGIENITNEKNQIEIWFKLAITKAHILMEKRKLFKPLIKIEDVNIIDMEYDSKRGQYFLEIKTPYTYFDKGKNITDKYANFMPNNPMRNPNIPENEILKIVLVKALTQFPRIFNKSFIDNNLSTEWCNYDQGKFSENLINKYAVNCLPYKISLIK
jgi:hypothetical protein